MPPPPPRVPFDISGFVRNTLAQGGGMPLQQRPRPSNSAILSAGMTHHKWDMQQIKKLSTYPLGRKGGGLSPIHAESEHRDNHNVHQVLYILR